MIAGDDRLELGAVAGGPHVPARGGRAPGPGHPHAKCPTHWSR